MVCLGCIENACLVDQLHRLRLAQARVLVVPSGALEVEPLDIRALARPRGDILLLDVEHGEVPRERVDRDAVVARRRLAWIMDEFRLRS